MTAAIPVFADPAFEFDCPKWRDFSCLETDADAHRDQWFAEQRRKYKQEKKQRKSLAKDGAAAMPQDKENTSANVQIAPSVPAASEAGEAKPVKSVAKPAASLRLSAKPRMSSTSVKHDSASVAANTQRVSSASAKPVKTAEPAPLAPRASAATAAPERHRRSTSAPAGSRASVAAASALAPCQQHQRSRSAASQKCAAGVSAIASVRSIAPLTRPSVRALATDARAQQRANSRSRDAAATAVITTSVSQLKPKSVAPRQPATMSARPAPSVTRCEPFKLATTERKRKPSLSTSQPLSQSHSQDYHEAKRVRPSAPVARALVGVISTPARPVAHSHRPLTSPSPFHLRSLARHAAAKAQLHARLDAERSASRAATVFRAPVIASIRNLLNAEPFAPILAHQHTECDNVQLSSEARAAARREWESEQRRLDEVQREHQRRQQEERAKQAARELAVLRASLVHRPLPVPSFERVFTPQPSLAPVTTPFSPMLLTKARASSHRANN